MNRITKPFIPLGLMLVMGGCTSAGDERASNATEDIVIADPERYAVEFENDIVRLLRIRYGPGEESVEHGHPAGCGVVLRGGTFGFVLPSGEVVTGNAVPYTVNCTDAEVHRPVNVGDSDAEFIFFDLKNRATFDNEFDPRRRGGVTSEDGMPDALAGDPHRYVQKFENDIVRVLRVRYPADGSSRMHSHPAHCSVYLTGGTYRFTSETGEVTTFERSPGQVECRDAEIHRSDNLGASPGAVLVFEMKDRDRLMP